MRVAVVVLAGGAARRWSGRDKTAVRLGNRTVLEHAVHGLVAGVCVAAPDADRHGVIVVVAGPADHAARPALDGVRWVREDPAGAGPVAGLAVAAAALPAEIDVVLVGAGDAPFGGSAVGRLLTALEGTAGGADGAIGVDPGGRRQPLLAAYRPPALRAALEALGDPGGAPLRAVLESLRLVEVAVSEREALDLDTPEALDVAVRELEGRATEVPETGRSS